MNYFAQGINQGAEIGARAYLEKQKQAEDARLAKARLDFEAAQLRAQFTGQQGLQTDRQLFEALQAGLGRDFTTRRDATLNGYDMTKLDKTQAFQGGENDKNRSVTTGEGDKNRTQAEKLANAEMFLKAQGLKQNGEQFDRVRSWDESPLNPDNVYKTSHSLYLLNPKTDDPTQNPGYTAIDALNAIKNGTAFPGRSAPNLPNAGTALQNGRTAALNASDQQALAYARANPNDPRSAAILQRLGMGK
jgi:hypothetical protein